MSLKTLKHKVSGLCSGEDRGVSPVIGVVLMVAITVILAAVIGAFVLGLGDEMGTGAQAGVDITPSESEDSDYTVTWTSEGNAVGIHIGTVEGDPDISSVGGSAGANENESVIAVTENGEETVIATAE